MTFSAKYFGANGWLIRFGDFQVLVDPWLTGILSFPPGEWLFRGELVQELEIPQGIDLILLSQGLPDHAHVPTLEKLSRCIPVVGSKSAIKVVSKLGFEKKIELSPGEVWNESELIVEATSGALVPNLENGYLIRHPFGSLYLEPHGFLDKKIKPQTLDAVISPASNLMLPMVGSFVKGKSVLPELIKNFKPLTFLTSTTGGDAQFSGLLQKIIQIEESSEEFIKTLDQEVVFIKSFAGNTYQLKTRSQ